MASKSIEEQYILDIKVSYEEAVKGIVKYQNEIKALKKKLEDLDTAKGKGTITEAEYNRETELTRAAINEYNRDIRSLRKEIQNNQRIEKEHLGSLQQKRAVLSNLVKQYDQMSEEQRKADKETGHLAKDIKKLTEELKQAEGETERFYRNVGNYKNSIIEAFTGNNKFAQSIMGMAQGGEGFKGVMQGMVGSVKAFGAALLALAANPVFLSIAGIAGAAAAFKWFYDYNQGIAEATRLTKEFLGISGEALTSVRNSIQATADTFDKDYKEVLTSVDALMAQYHISAEEAIKVINDGFVSGADVSGNFLNQLNQFAPSFHDAGVSASELVAIISQTRSGIFSEGGMNVIQMASNRIRTMSKNVQESLDAIGISSKQTEDDLKNGTKTTFDVIQEVARQLKTLPQDSAEVGTALKDIFGKTAANEGMQMIERLDTMTTKIEEVKAVTGEWGEAQQEQIEAAEELNNAMSTLFDMSENGWETMMLQIKTIATKWLAAAINAFTKFINRVIDLYNNSMLFRGLLQIIIVLFRNLWSVASGTFNLIVTAAKSVGRSLEGIAYILEGILTLSIDKAKEGFKLLTSNIGKTITEGRGDIRRAGASMAQNMIDGWNNTVNNTPIARLTPDGGVASGTGGGGIAPIVGGGGGSAKGGGGGSTGKGKASTAANKAAADARKREAEEIKKAEELLLQLVEKSYEQQRQVVSASYDRKIRDVKLKLETEKNLTEATIKAMNDQIVALERLKQRDLDKLSDEQLKKRTEQANKEIAMYLATVRKGSLEEFNLKQQQLANQQAIEEADARRAETDEESRLSMLAAIRAKYAQQEKQLLDDLTKAEEDALKKRYEARLLAAKGDGSDPYPELTQLRIELEMRKALLDNARQLETESEEEFNNRRLQLAADYQQAKQAITEKEIAVEQAKYEALSAFVGGLQEVSEAFSEKSRTLAKISKVLALAEIAINSGVAVAAGIKQAQSVPYPANLVAIATTVATILSGIASAIKTVKGAKFASGGYVRGAGSATSDSIPARLSNGEAVIAAAPTAMFAPILSALNQLGGGAPIIVQSPQQQIGEDFLASAVAKGMALAPRPIVSVEEINNVDRRVDVIENLGTL